MSTPLQDTRVRDVMTPRPSSIYIDAGLDVAIETMRTKDIRRLPVLGRADQLKGMITLEDARRNMPRGVPHSNAGEEAEAKIPAVRKAMSRGLVTVGAADSLGKAAQLMVHHKIGALPVMDKGEMIGIITESDIFKYLARDLPGLQSDEDFS